MNGQERTFALGLASKTDRYNILPCTLLPINNEKEKPIFNIKFEFWISIIMVETAAGHKAAVIVLQVVQDQSILTLYSFIELIAVGSPYNTRLYFTSIYLVSRLPA